MDESLLTSLCIICHIDPPKYTCPRCFAETCSLTCSKRHKIWSSCNGIRDPTIYKPISQVATPAGIDHDYNFLHSIEHGISRSEKVLIEDIGLVSREELRRARAGQSEETRWKNHKTNDNLPGETCIRRVAHENNIEIVKAPKGMRRNKENTTTWSRKRKTVDWQVEWLRGAASERILYKIAGDKPIRHQYNIICEEDRKMKMTDEERREIKKRKAQDLKDRAFKKAKTELYNFPNYFISHLQDPKSKAWCIKPELVEYLEENPVDDSSKTMIQKNYFYIHRPLTPASFPRVIAEIDSEKSLTENLANRCVLEYPTIYVFDHDSSQLPDKFMLEKDYLEIISKKCYNGYHDETSQANKSESLSESRSSSESSESSDESSIDSDEEEIRSNEIR